MEKVTRSLFAIITRSLILNSLVISLLFLTGIVSLYHLRLQEQRSDAAARLNILLQVSLENAMLKRDIPGLREIVERFGQQGGISAVMILNPTGEVRFASRPDLLARRFDLSRPDLCPDCAWDGKTVIERSDLLARGIADPQPVIRSIKTVANRAECGQCHGEASASPVNGILVVDHEAQDLRRKALASALALAGSGLVVVLGLIGGIYLSLRKNVLVPVAQLQEASQAIAAGDLSRRVEMEGGEELASLGRTFNDMADRLSASLADVRAREHFVQSMIEALPDGIRVIDEDFRIILANQAYRDLHQHRSGSEIGAFCYRSSHGRSEPCISTLSTCPLVALREPTARIKFHAIHYRADRSEMSVEVNAARVATESAGVPRSLVVEVIRDLDAAVQISHEQRLSELGQLATGVAHEIRNPLSSVAILLQEAETALGQGQSASIGSSLHLISNEVGRCLSITESLLKLGVPPAPERELILINDVVEDILKLLRFQAEETRVFLAVDMEDDLRVLASDSDIRIVIINLVQNAFHAMPKGGHLQIEGRRLPEGQIALRFADTGIGIAPEDLRSIFLPFWSRRADGIHGTGLGLSICRSVLRALGGDIHVVSTRGRGTTFTILLPDADFEPGEPRRAA